MRKILVCEDEDAIREFVVINLQRSGYNVTAVSSGEEGLEVFDKNGGDYDVVLLDIMMSGIDGFAVCQKIRSLSSTIGIIMLTAKTQEMDKVRGLMLGADDYATKPFSPSELVARVDAVYRRVHMINGSQSETAESGPFVLNRKSRQLTKNGEMIDLTQVEYQIMDLFLRNQEVALARTRILNEIWGDSYDGDDKIVDVNVRRLRMKIEDEPSHPAYIQTIWGFGYKWKQIKEEID